MYLYLVVFPLQKTNKQTMNSECNTSCYFMVNKPLIWKYTFKILKVLVSLKLFILYFPLEMPAKVNINRFTNVYTFSALENT